MDNYGKTVICVGGEIMKTIALRYSDNYAPEEGMLYHHKQIIEKYGYVWYGKFGNRI